MATLIYMGTWFLSGFRGCCCFCSLAAGEQIVTDDQRADRRDPSWGFSPVLVGGMAFRRGVSLFVVMSCFFVLEGGESRAVNHFQHRSHWRPPAVCILAKLVGQECLCVRGWIKLRS